MECKLDLRPLRVPRCLEHFGRLTVEFNIALAACVFNNVAKILCEPGQNDSIILEDNRVFGI